MRTEGVAKTSVPDEQADTYHWFSGLLATKLRLALLSPRIRFYTPAKGSPFSNARCCNL
jgi:hypothetical protein